MFLLPPVQRFIFSGGSPLIFILSKTIYFSLMMASFRYWNFLIKVMNWFETPLLAEGCIVLWYFLFYLSKWSSMILIIHIFYSVIKVSCCDVVHIVYVKMGIFVSTPFMDPMIVHQNTLSNTLTLQLWDCY